MSEITDLKQRAEAIDPSRSFIVQAPAGSGKTELLIRRYLNLLACVEAPEEILAITFTRKAAGEMRERVVGALDAARSEAPPAEEHKVETWRIARRARARDRELGWELERHPARMRILTIDAFNVALTRQLPVLSGYGAPPVIADDPAALYREAAHRLVGQLEEGGGWSDAVADFLLHLDNRLDQALERIADMLRHRDQWLPRLVGNHDTGAAALETAYAREMRLYLEQAGAMFPAEQAEQCTVLAGFAAANLADRDTVSPVRHCRDLQSLPGTEPDELPQWLGLAELLLTKDGKWRAQFSKAIGFEPGNYPEKDAIKALIAHLGRVDGLGEALHRLRALPDRAAFADEQRHVLNALLELLPLAVAQLQLVFAERGEVDYPEMALRAHQALGDEERPTDLALALDYRIRHVLVDEFQDTSTTQFQLLESLTRGWTPGDGHTLFLVGDPMQSIYRFREAEVGLFLRARQHGIGDVPLEFLRLETNFRSHAPLVDWVNDGFRNVLAEQEDIAAGAVPFERATPHKPDDDSAVGVHADFSGIRDPAAEARRVVTLARQRLAETEDGTVAILVRDRNHAAGILPALRAAGLSFRSVEMERLATRPVVQDLTALCRALVHDADRTAWLAVLRAPWCGLSLADLLQVANAAANHLLPASLADLGLFEHLSDDGRQRVQRVRETLRQARELRRRGTLRQRVETTWLALGGPAACDAAALEDAEAFLSLLEETEQAGDLDDAQALEAAMKNLYARPDPEGSERLQVMTMHGAKGLEFDTVILPGLHKPLKKGEQRLLLWSERLRVDDTPDLLLAPVRPAGRKEKDAHYDFVQTIENEKESHEQGRLLYVAITRAVRRLDLPVFLNVERDKKGNLQLKQPRKNCLLFRLWPLVQEQCETAFAERKQETSYPEATQETPITGIRRVPAGWRLPDPAPAVAWEGGLAEGEAEEFEVEYEWAGETARVVGTVVHRFLQQIAEDGLERWSDQRIEAQRPTIRAMLAGLGADPQELEEAENRAVRALTNTLADETGRWILQDHPDAHNELALATWASSGPETHIIDRTFTDADGTRWIIDYKTGYREGADIPRFLEQEMERHGPQLQRYRKLLESTHDATTRTALYFPLLGAFREVG